MHLEVYVTEDCSTCAEAQIIAEQAQTIPHLRVSVIYVGKARQPPPDNVVAVPTYLLDGRVVSLGNPDRQEFLSDLARRGAEGTS
jgi:hypothetical protein